MQKKTVIAGFVLDCAMMLAGFVTYAQAPESTGSSEDSRASARTDLDIQQVRDDIRAHRKQITAANMVLTPDEATKFWPIYDRYIQETIKINDARWALMKDYAANYDKMSDQLAEDYMKKSAVVDQQLVELRERYVPIFEKVVSPKKTALWYQIDRRLDLVINLQLSAMIPAVDATK